MSEQAEAALKKQYKLLKKAIKLELKRTVKTSESAGKKLMGLSEIEISALAKDMVSQAFESSISSPDDTIVHKITPKPSSMSFALKPFKKSPCKSCPALNGGLCQCAIKQKNKSDMSAVS